MNSIAFGFVWFLTHISSFSFSLNPDGLSLLALKAAITTDPTRVLATWSESDSTHVTGLESHVIDTTESPPFLSPTKASLATFLLRSQISTLRDLTHLDLSSNHLNGSLPESLSNLTHLVGTLNLSYNIFSGEVPASYGRFPVMVSLDLQHNNLTGKIPLVGSLLNQGPTAFSGNPNLCGFPLQTQCPGPEAQNPRSIFTNPENPSLPNGFVERGNVRNGSVTVSLISSVSVVIGIVFVSVWVIRKKWRSTEGKTGKEKLEKEVGSSSSIEGQKGKFVVMDEGFGLELEDLLRASAYVVGKSKGGIVYKVVVGGGRGSGVAGAAVAVRRLSETETRWRFKDFESEVEAIGRVHHPNIVRLRAYYYASDEKLLITDFISNGTLYAALHGGPDNSLSSLSWISRLKIAQGTARGLVHIQECSPRKHVHGNLRSSKVLLDDDLQPYISGFGLTRLVSGASKSTNSASKKQSSNQIVVSPKNSTSSSIMYVAPEARVQGNKFTQKCDVYSFGIVLLEILTGRLPDGGPDSNGKGLESLVRKVFREERPLSEIIDPALLHEVHAKKQVVAAFHIALNCTELDPEFRPRMRTVSESLDCIKLQ
ncbi:unnamed protein product [Ilex paraguariensis]|uniref:Protein kinase domain-containing protein n=1 Tax=Ilex paraguariensis TaxID=185542 RepID=A0ABC8UKY9_9AQUA